MRMSDETELYSLYDFLHDRDVEQLEEWQGKGVEFVELPAESVTHDEKTDVDPWVDSDAYVKEFTAEVKFWNNSQECELKISVDGNVSTVAPTGSLKLMFLSESYAVCVYTAILTGEVVLQRVVHIQQVTASETKCPLLTSLWERISLRVNERFARYFIAGETLEDWQRMLQVTTDSVALRYERMLRLYQADTESDLFAGTRTIYDTLDANEGKTSGDSRYSDTPDTGVNDKGDYASSRNSTSGTSAYTDKRTGTVTQQVMGNGGVLSAINENSDAWRDIETRIVEEFRECFLTVIWY